MPWARFYFWDCMPAGPLRGAPSVFAVVCEELALHPSRPRLPPLGEDGPGTPSAEVLSWNLGDLVDHLIQPTQVTDGKTVEAEVKLPSNQRRQWDWNRSPTQVQVISPPHLFPYSNWGYDPEGSLPALPACLPPSLPSLVYMGSGVSCWPTARPGPSGHVGPCLSWHSGPRVQQVSSPFLVPLLSPLGRSPCLSWATCACL